MTKGSTEKEGESPSPEAIITEVEEVNHNHNAKANQGAFPQVEDALDKVLGPIGFEAWPFRVEWYNELVGPRFQLDYSDDTVAYVVLSGPETFEKCIVPFAKVNLQADKNFSCRDPLDDSMKCLLKAVTKNLIDVGCEVDSFHDFDLHPNRKPKILVQTAAHVSGAVEYFHRDRLKIKNPSWCKDWKLYGVAIHPIHGGWFAIRGVVILKNVLCNGQLVRPNRPITGVSEEVVTSLLEEFGSNWKMNAWRDIIPIPRQQSTRYSHNFIQYLATESSDRWDFVKSIIRTAEVER